MMKKKLEKIWKKIDKNLKTFFKVIQYGNNVMNDEKKKLEKNWEKFEKKKLKKFWKPF